VPKPQPVLLTVDVVALTLHPEDGLSVLVVRRGSKPFQGRWALPGGFVDPGEELETAAARELQEETGVSPRRVRLEQLGAYGATRRDPRGRVVSVAFLVGLPWTVEPRGGDDADDARWMSVVEARRPRRLAFDHRTILDDAVERAASLVERCGFAARLLPRTFTVSDLREVYEQLWGVALDAGNFQRKVTGVPGLLRPTGGSVQRGRGRPAALFTARTTAAISPPLLRLG
jgi:8-oxo-dGTP diphosphatase